MKVLILSNGTGSRGSVQPFVALARALNVSGHEAVLAAPSGSGALAKSHGVSFLPLNDDLMKLRTSPVSREAIDADPHDPRRRKLRKQVWRQAHAIREQTLGDVAEACETGADIVVIRPMNPAQEIAERLGVPVIPVWLQPPLAVPGANADHGLSFQQRLPTNRVPYLSKLSTTLLLRCAGEKITKLARETLGMPRPRDIISQAHDTERTVLQAVSRYVLPSPAGDPDSFHTTGFWFLPAAADWSPAPDLSGFLAAGDPPVYVGFSSTIGSDPHRTGRIVAEAIRLARVRAVVATGWGGIQLGEQGEDMLILDQVPHDWLFPRMAAVVHHGGSGTTGAALASGRPQVVCPFSGDQPFFAQRMHASGVAPVPQPHRNLTAEGLAAAIRQAVTDSAMAARAIELGCQVRAEGGVTTAVEILESLA